jgi:hypothetical protein
MCLRFQFYIHHRVCIFHFLKKVKCVVPYCTVCPKFDMVWLYRLPIPVGRGGGGNFLVQIISTCLRGGGGEGGRHRQPVVHPQLGKVSVSKKLLYIFIQCALRNLCGKSQSC